MFNNKKLISIIILVIGLIILFFLISSANNKKSDKFIGSIKSVGESSMIVSGSFEDEKKLGRQLYEYEISVNSSTKIVKNSFVLPKDGKMFEVSKLPKETTDVAFDTLKKDSENVAIGIEVTLNRNFLGMVQKSAKRIIYIGPKY